MTEYRNALSLLANELSFVELFDQFIETRTQLREMTMVNGRNSPEVVIEYYRTRFNEIYSELERRTQNV